MPIQLDSAAIQSYVEQHLPRYLDLLEQMVNINSFTANADGVNTLGNLTADAFAGFGFSAERISGEPPTPGQHLILTRPGRLGKKIGLVSHLDTVFPPEEEIANDFHWRIAGDRIYGPGTVDIKGGTVMIYAQLELLRAMAPEAFEDITWVVMLNAGEEVGAQDFGPIGCRYLQDGGVACLVYEGGHVEDNTYYLVNARKGKADYAISIEGRAAHAGNGHHLGVNAVVQMADVIQKIAAFTDYEKNITFNVGVANGGTVVNRVPHEAGLQVEMRAFDLSVFEHGLSQMLALNDYVSVYSAQDHYPGKVTVEVLRRSDPWPVNEGTDQLLNLWAEVGKSLGMDIKPEARGGLSDGNGIWRCVPTMDGLGPSGSNAHCSERSADGSKDQEYMLRSSFVPKMVLNTLGLVELLNRTRQA